MAPPDPRSLAEEGRAADLCGDARSALDLYQRAAGLLEGSNDPLLADVLRWAGTVHRELGEPHLAAPLYERSLAMAEAAGYLAGRAHVLNCQALLQQWVGRGGEARELWHQAGALAEASGERRLTAMIHHNQGILASVQGDRDEALRRCRLALGAFQDERDQLGMAEVLNTLGMIHAAGGAWHHAEAAFDEGLELSRHLGARAVVGILECNLADARIAADRLDEAEVPLRHALEEAQRRHDSGRTALALKTRARLQVRRGRTNEAAHDLARALVLAEQAEDALLSAEIQRATGELCLQLGERQRARDAYSAASRGFTVLGAGPAAAALEAQVAALAG